MNPQMRTLKSCAQPIRKNESVRRGKNYEATILITKGQNLAAITKDHWRNSLASILKTGRTSTIYETSTGRKTRVSPQKNRPHEQLIYGGKIFGGKGKA
jgi:hypothetical protein